MGKQVEDAVINVVINGEKAISSFTELNRLRRDQLGLVQSLNRNSPEYAQQQRRLEDLNAAHRAWRAEINNSTAAIDRMNGEMNETGKNGFFDKMKSMFSKDSLMVAGGNLMASGFEAGVSAVKSFINGSEAAYIEAVKGQAQIDAALKSTQGIAGMTKDALSDMSTELMNQTGVDDDVISKGESMLLTFTNIRGKIYEQALPAIVDMTAAMNQGAVTMEGIQGTSIQVGKALNDPIKGVTALAKVGVSFTEQQKEQIKSMVANNDVMGAQTIILKELSKEFGGTAKAIADTDPGTLQKFATSIGNLQENMGGFITTMKVMLASVVTPFIEWLGKSGTAGEQAANEFKQAAAEVDGLQKNIVPLLSRYDELKAKASLNKTEHAEMNTIIGKVTQAIPGMATEFDKYGQVIGISTDKAREFIAQQKAMLTYKNQDAIKKTKEDIAEFTEKMKEFQKVVNTGYTENKMMDFFFGGEHKGFKQSQKGIQNATEQVAKYGTLLQGAQKTLSELTGQDIVLPEPSKVKAPTGGPSAADLAKERSAKEKAAKELTDYQQHLRDAQAEVNKFMADATKGTADNLDAQLQVINDKYQKLIDRLKTLNANKNATGNDKKANNTAISGLEHERDNEKDDLSAEVSYDGFEKTINDDAEQQQNNAKAKLADHLISEEDFAASELEIEQKRLSDLYDIRVLFGMQTQDLETKLADGRVKTEKKAFDTHMRMLKEQAKNEQDYQRIQKDISNQKAQLAETGVQILTSAFGRSKGVLFAQLAVEKAIAIGRILAQEGIEIAAYYAHAAVEGGIFGALAVTPFAAAAKVRAGFSIAQIVASGVLQGISIANTDTGTKSDKKYAQGGMLPEGPSHANGGLKLVDPYGMVYGEVEGGEPILSKDTYVNNRSLVDALLNSRGRSLNMNRIREAVTSRERRVSNFPSATTDPQNSSVDKMVTALLEGNNTTYAALIDKLDDVTAAISDQQVTLSNRLFEKKSAKNAKIRNDANV